MRPFSRVFLEKKYPFILVGGPVWAEPDGVSPISEVSGACELNRANRISANRLIVNA
jgi:hypothetical protein